MKLHRLILLLLMLPAAFCPPVAQAQYTSYSIQRLMAELTDTLDDVRDAEVALRENRRVMQEYGKEKEALDRERATYDRDVDRYNSDLKVFNDEVGRYQEQCNKQLQPREFRECEDWAETLDPKKSALDERLSRLNERKAALNEKIAERNQRETVRSAEADELLAQYDDYDKQAQAYIDELTSREVFRSSNRNCANSPSLEATQECLRKILEEAP